MDGESDRGVAPVHQVVPTRHEGRVVGQEEADERSDLVRLYKPAERMPRDKRLFWSAGRFAKSGVSMYAGPTQLILSPCGPYSAAAFFVRPTTPCLAAVYAPFPMAATMPWIEAMLTIAELRAPAFSIAGIW